MRPAPANERQTLAHRLRVARLLAGFKTLNAAARRSGISANTIKGYEASKSVPSVFKLARLADAYDVSCDWLVGRPESHHVEEGTVLVDTDHADAVFRATTAGELEDLLNWDPPMLGCVTGTSKRSKIVSAAEGIRLVDRLTAHVHEVAPELAANWRRRFNTHEAASFRRPAPPSCAAETN